VPVIHAAEEQDTLATGATRAIRSASALALDAESVNCHFGSPNAASAAHIASVQTRRAGTSAHRAACSPITWVSGDANSRALPTCRRC
jgi:hypothetical protein